MSKINNIIKIKGVGESETYVLQCLVFSSFKLEESLNQTRQISFTAYDDNSVGYLKLINESSIYFDNQEYIIKQVQSNSTDGVETKEVTATHVQFDLARFRQRETKTGTLTYLPQDVLDFYLNGNPFGFTWEVIGEFPKQQITDLGNSSGSDMLSKITSTWANAVIYADNRNIKVYTLEALKKHLGNRIDYLHNTSSVQLTTDTTTPLVNQLKCFGKTKDNTENTEYYFEPFIVQDDASIQKYGVWVGDDLSDERFTNAESMRAYAISKLQGEPSVSITTNILSGSKPTLGEVKHLKVATKNLETDVTLVGFTWYPFDKSQLVSETYSNLPLNILRTNILTQRRLKNLSAENKRQEKIRQELSDRLRAYQKIQDSLSLDVYKANSLVNSMISTSESISKSLSESISKSASESVSESDSITQSEVRSEN